MSDVMKNDLLFGDIKNIIETSKKNVAQIVNSTLTEMNWHIGQLIDSDILNNQRADYGKEVLKTLSYQLTND